MEGLTVVLLIAAVAAWLNLKYGEDRNWENLWEAYGQRNEIEEFYRKFAYLKNHRIRCRIKTLSPGLAKGLFPSTQASMRIEVHKTDAAKARELIQYLDNIK